MTSVKFGRIPTFTDYCHKGKKLNEENTANIKVEVEWWQDAVNQVLGELHCIAGTPVEWERLLDYCRARNLILGREAPFFVDELVLALIRELIFQYYGSTFFDGQDMSGSSFKSAELGTKILVVSQLGDEILKQVKIEAGLISVEPEEIESPNTVASVSLDSEYGEIEDDLPFESHKALHQVYGFEEFDKLVEEAYCHLQFDHYNTVIDKCLKDLEDVAPGLEYKKVLKAAKKETKGKDDDEIVDNYLSKLARVHMRDEQIRVQDVELSRGTVAKFGVFKAARDLFIFNIVEDIKKRFQKR